MAIRGIFPSSELTEYEFAPCWESLAVRMELYNEFLSQWQFAFLCRLDAVLVLGFRPDLKCAP
jgi:hypothetical protein